MEEQWDELVEQLEKELKRAKRMAKVMRTAPQRTKKAELATYMLVEARSNVRRAANKLESLFEVFRNVTD